MISSSRKFLAVTGIVGGAGTALYFLLTKDIHTYKEIEPDSPVPPAPAPGAPPPAPAATPNKTGYKRVDAILGKLRDAANSSGIPLGLMVGWIAKESGGKLSDTTSLDERGYFQLMPAESKSIGVDHERLSTDSDYSIDAGVKLIQLYKAKVDALGIAPAGSSYFWRLVKLVHSMGAGQVKKIVTAAENDDSAGSWDDLEEDAQGMHITGPQPKKWFKFVDSVYAIGAPFGFGNASPASVGRINGFDLLGAESV